MRAHLGGAVSGARPQRAAFGLPDDCAFIALWQSGQGFVMAECLTPDEYDELRKAYDNQDQEE